jgi:hypothetical protein
MQSKALLTRLKKLEKKATGNKKFYVFFGQPSKAELERIPPSAKTIIFVGEDKIPE